MSGCYTPLPNIVMSLIVLLFLVVITPLFKYTPNSVISAIIINAIIGLVDFRSAFKIYKVDKVDFLACLGAFLGVIFKSVEVGLLISVSIQCQSYKYRIEMHGDNSGTACVLYQSFSYFCCLFLQFSFYSILCI